MQSKIGTILSEGTNLGNRNAAERQRRSSARRVNQESCTSAENRSTYLGNWPLPAAAADPRPVDAETLLCLVAEAASLVWTSGAGHAAYRRELSVFPDADALQETKDVALLLLPEFFDVFVSLQCKSGFVVNLGFLFTKTLRREVQLKIAGQNDDRRSYADTASSGWAIFSCCRGTKVSGLFPRCVRRSGKIDGFEGGWR